MSDAALPQRAARGAAWMLGLRLSQRALGVARLLALTHLLAPEHFGAMGIALLLVEALNALSHSGFQTALIQRPGRVEPYLDAAWTALVARGVALFALLFAAAPFAAGFFDVRAATPLIRVVGVSVLLQSLSNVGVVLLERELRFRRLAAFQLGGTAVECVAAVAAALALRSAWALAIGMLAGDAARLVLSYCVHPHRPRPRLDGARMRELFGFGKWLLLSQAFLFLAHQGDDVVVGRWLGAAALGLYQLAYQVAHLPVLELSRVVSQVSLPSFARLRAQPERLRRSYLSVLQGMALLAWPVAALIALLAGDAFRIALPERWLPAAPLVCILALHAGVRATGAASGSLLVAVGRPRALTGLTLLKGATLGVAIFPLVGRWGATGVALSVLGASLVSNAAAHARACRVLACRTREALGVLSVPLLATAGMAAFLVGLRRALPVEGLATLALHAGLGLAVYALGAALLGRVGPYPLSVWARGLAGALLAARPAPEDR